PTDVFPGVGIEIVENEVVAVQPMRSRTLLPVVASGLQTENRVSECIRTEVKDLDAHRMAGSGRPVTRVIGRMAQHPAIRRKWRLIVVAKKSLIVVRSDARQGALGGRFRRPTAT